MNKLLALFVLPILGVLALAVIPLIVTPVQAAQTYACPTGCREDVTTKGCFVCLTSPAPNFCSCLTSGKCP